jgi:Sulfotransferase family
MNKAETLTIPPDYNAIFQGRVLIITGVGRSGTTILGKLIGSMRPAFYLFEPAILSLMPLLIEQLRDERPQATQLMRSVLFEDYFLQLIHGRTLNFNSRDDSYFGNYFQTADVEQRWQEMPRRQDVMAYLEKTKVIFLMKMPEFQPLFEVTEAIFPNPRFLHIIRNGLDVVASSLKRGWFTDEFMGDAYIGWVRADGAGNVAPWPLDDESRALFPRWTPATRSASLWRQLTQKGIDYASTHKDKSQDLRYEDLLSDPRKMTAEIARRFGLEITKITEKNLDKVRNFDADQYSLGLNDIEEPERTRFGRLMEQLGYL